MEQNFILRISGTEHGEWQGHIAREGAPPTDFQSVLELLKILNRELEKEA